MVKLMFFDFDGTLLDSERLWRQAPIRMLCAHNLVVPDSILSRQDELHFRDSVREIHENKQLAKQLGMTHDECLQWCFHNMTPLYHTSIPLKPGAEELLRCVREKGITAVMVTATEHPNAVAACERLGIADYFSHFHSTFGEAEKKSSPALFERLAAQFGVRPDECLLLDDAAYALEGARKAGCFAWAIEDEVHKLETEKIVRTADRYFKTLADVKNALQEMA